MFKPITTLPTIQVGHSKRRSGAQASRQSQRSAAAPSRWPSFFAGIVVGLAASWLAPKLLENNQTNLYSNKGSDSSQAESGAEAEPTQFNFPQLFKESEVIVSEGELTQPSAAEQNSDYFVQVGSFRDSGDADSLRARLLLLNLDASVESVSGETGLWHRVVSGPYSTPQAAEQARNKLHANNIQTLVLKRQR